MSDEITKEKTWLGKALDYFFKSNRKVDNKPKNALHGASWNNPYGTKQSFDAINSLSAYAVHGYTHAAVKRASEDLAAIPLRVTSGKGKNTKTIDEGAIVDLLEHPSLSVDGFSLREQLCIDLMLSGNCYLLLLGATLPPVSVVRLHPAEVKIVTNDKGEVSYEHSSSGASVIYPSDRVIHTKTASWNAGPQGLYGTGAIEPLAKEIQADINAQKLVSEASKKGRPDILLSPKDEADIWGHERRREILDQYKGLANQGGALVLSGQVDVKELKLSPREMEYQAARTTARQSISAVFGVPPSILGLPTANYATSRQQAINYWGVQKKRGRRFDSMFTRLARLFDDSYRVTHDYSGIEALQAVRVSQLQRVQMHLMNGMKVEDAYKFEGLEEAPIAQAPKVEDEIEQDARSLFRLLEEPKKKAQ